MLWIYAEDLGFAIIGPFVTPKQAEDHVRFCINRGDTATHRILDDAEKHRVCEEDRIDVIAPMEDRVVYYSSDLEIKNLDQLPGGTGCPLLECLLDDGKYIAIRWRRVPPASLMGNHVLISFMYLKASQLLETLKGGAA